MSAVSRLLAPVALAMLAVTALAGCTEEPVPVGRDGCPVRDVEVVRDVDVRVMVGGARVGPTARQEVPIDLRAEWPDGARWTCVRAITATLAWSNGASQGADLYVGLLDAEAGIDVTGQDHQQLPADGANSESVEAPAPSDPMALEDGLTLVVYSDWASLAAGNLDAVATITLRVPASDAS